MRRAGGVEALPVGEVDPGDGPGGVVDEEGATGLPGQQGHGPVGGAHVPSWVRVDGEHLVPPPAQHRREQPSDEALADEFGREVRLYAA